ncbi:MAG: hypothetical protein KF683_00910 [Rubrivivax sp.]|nr:hypothetical protein [Rubrivivax sp.]
MATVSREARISLTARDNTKPAFTSVQGNFAGVQRQVASVGAAFAGLGATLGAVLGGFGVGALVRNVTQGLTALKDLSEATGSSIERLSALQDIAGRTGNSFESVGNALTRFNQALNAGDRGDVAEVLRAIGLSAEELRRLDPAQALVRTSQALDKFAADGNRARAEQILFGRSIREAAPLLREFAENSERLGSATADQVRAADEFNKSLARTQYNARLAARTIGSELLPTLNTLTAELARATEGSGAFAGVGTAVRIALEALIVTGATVADTFRGVVAEVTGIGRQLGALARLDVKGFNAISQAMREDALRARAELDDFVRRVMRTAETTRRAAALASNFQPKGPPAVGLPSITVGGGTARAVRQQASEYDKYIDRLRETLLRTQELSAAEQARIDINRGLLGKLDEASRAQLLSLAAGVDARSALTRQQQEAQKLADEGRRIFEATRTEQEKLNAQLARADVLLDAGAIGWGTYGRVVTGALGDSLQAMNKIADSLPALDQVSQRVQQIGEFAQQAGRNIQDALGDSILRVLEGDFKNIGRLWVDLLRRMVAQAAAAQVGKALFGSGVGTGEGALGPFFASLFGGNRATGGPIQAGRVYRINELGGPGEVANVGGRQYLLAARSGSIEPSGGTGGPVFNFAPVLHVNGDVSPQTVAMMQQMIRAEQRRWQRSIAMQGGG